MNHQAVDLELCELIFQAERNDLGMTATLYFNGMMIGGQLVGSRNYYQWTGDALRRFTASEGVTGDMVARAQEQYYKWGEQAREASTRREDKLKAYLNALESGVAPDWEKVAELTPVFVHLANVSIRGATPSVIYPGGTLMRGEVGDDIHLAAAPIRIRLDSVTAWHLGTLGEPNTPNPRPADSSHFS